MRHYCFLVRRPIDSAAWPLIFTDMRRAYDYPNRVSSIVEIELAEDGALNLVNAVNASTLPRPK